MTKEKANRNEVVGMFLTYCRKTLEARGRTF